MDDLELAAANVRAAMRALDVHRQDGAPSLEREYRKALASRLSPPCGKVAGMFVQHTNLEDLEADRRKLVCYDCGIACDLGAMRSERQDYLVKLGAKTKRAAAISPLDAPAPAKEDHVDPKRAKVSFTQGAAIRYRFGFTKLGPSALLSHLDLLRALPRAFRRVGLPLFYSTGFHPKPDFVFAPALSLGVSSTCEVADVKLTCDIDPETFLAALSESSPDGLDFYAGARLGPTDRAVSRLIDTARYAVAIPTSVLGSLDGPDGLRGRVESAMAAKELRLKRMVEGIGKMVDVREYLRAIEIDSPAARAATADAGLVGSFVVLAVDLEIRGSGAIKIAEVVEALAGVNDLPHRAVRFAMGTWDAGTVVSPFVLGRHAPAAEQVIEASSVASAAAP